MGLRVRTNVASLVAQRHLSNNNEALGESLEKLSSGYRINKSKDDAAGLAVTETMRAKIRGLNQAKRNGNDAISMLQVAEGAMNEMGNMLTRMRELTVQAATDTIGDRERSFLNREYTQLAEEIDRIAATTEFNGNFFFSTDEGSLSQFVIQVGTNGTLPELNRDALSVDLDGLRFSAEVLGIGKGAEIGPMKDLDEVPSRDGIADKLAVIDGALERLAGERGGLGSLQSRLGSTINNLAIQVENLETAKSRIKDVDFAEATTELTQRRILSQGNLSVLAQANQMPEMALSLLR